MHKHRHALTCACTQEDVCAKRNDVRRGKKCNVVRGNSEREREGEDAASLGASRGLCISWLRQGYTLQPSHISPG